MVFTLTMTLADISRRGIRPGMIGGLLYLFKDVLIIVTNMVASKLTIIETTEPIDLGMTHQFHKLWSILAHYFPMTVLLFDSEESNQQRFNGCSAMSAFLESWLSQ